MLNRFLEISEIKDSTDRQKMTKKRLEQFTGQMKKTKKILESWN